MKYDVALVEKPVDEGLTAEEIMRLPGMIDDESFIPIEVQSESSCAMGFIGLKKAEMIGYAYLEGDDLYEMIRDILCDTEKETENGDYIMMPGNIRIHLTR